MFGGTFNPVHLGHLRAAEEVMELLKLHRVMFVPAFSPPFNKTSLVPFEHRMKMVRLAISGNSAFTVSDIESRITGRSFTALTLERLKTSRSKDRFFFIMGADAFLELPKWYRPERVLELADLAVLMRPPLDIKALHKSPLIHKDDKKKLIPGDGRSKISLRTYSSGRRIILLRTTPLDISATRIRSIIRRGKSAKYLLPERIESYIISNKLYM